MTMMNLDRYLVVDTTFLDAFYRLKLMHIMNMLYSRVLIPVAVEYEFLSEKNRDRDKRYQYISTLFENHHWIQKCTTYHPDDVKLIQAEPDIDKGEAEVMAQTQKLGQEVYPKENLYSVIDEKRGREVAGNMQLKITGTLYILALISLHRYVNFDESVQLLREQGVRYSNKVIKKALEKATNDFASGSIRFIK